MPRTEPARLAPLFFFVLPLAQYLAPAAAMRAEAMVTPTQKVIQLMEGMVAKGKKDKQAEQVEFAAYKAFCDSTSSQKQASIKAANEKIDVLKADVEQYDTDAGALGEAIAQHNEDVSVWEGDLSASLKVREIENSGFSLTQTDYIEAIQHLDDGMATIKKLGRGSVAGAAAFLQMKTFSGLKIPDAINAFFAMGALRDPDDLDENLADAAPEAAAHESHSQGILDMLAGMKAKFQDELSELESMETEAANAYEMMCSDLARQIDKANSASSEKSQAKGKALEMASTAKADLEDTTKTRDDDIKFLSDLSSTCELKASAFAEGQTVRSEEIEAIGKAIELISGADNKAGIHLPKLVQLKAKGPVLTQLRSGSQDPAQLRVVTYLQDQAAKVHSRLLSVLATRAAADPMKKIKKMIKDLIVKLIEEANQEAEQKGFCDAEMATNEQTRTEKGESIENLNAQIDELNASIGKLGEDIASLTQAVSELSAAVSKATSIRADEKEKNTATIKDAQEAQTAVAQAVAVLKQFYDKQAESTSFVQQPSDEPYRGMGAESGGILGMIEVIQSDFARVESETSRSEESSSQEYDQFMNDSEVDQASKKSDIADKKGSLQNQKEALSEAKVDLEGEQKELGAAMAYWEKLKPTCIDEVESYEDRVARRKEEIQSLQEALQILTE